MARDAIVGGGSGIIRSGGASLAHHGCLFLDEARHAPGTHDRDRFTRNGVFWRCVCAVQSRFG